MELSEFKERLQSGDLELIRPYLTILLVRQPNF